MIRLVLLLALPVGLLACQRVPQSSSPWVQTAPTSPQETGLILQTDASTARDLLEKPGVSMRLLHPQSGLYEIYGLSESAAHLLAGGRARFFGHNVYFTNLVPDESRRKHNAAEGEITALLDSCRHSETPPKAVIVNESPRLLVGRHAPVGQKIVLSAVGSESAHGPDSRLQTFWIVRAPFTSKVGVDGAELAKLKLEPDAVGRFEVTLLVRDVENACQTTTLTFAATHDPKLIRTTKRRSLRTNEDELFPHLATVRARQAWEITRGRGVVIAIVDTGVNYNHPALSPNIAISVLEIPGNNIDDDRNGLIDDDGGWDFINADNRPFDDDGHGTHVAGLAAATTMGIAPEARLLPIKAINGMGGGDAATIAAGIMYAADQGAGVINLSFGSIDPSFAALRFAVEYAERKGSIIVAAAGNGDVRTGLGLNLDVHSVLPATLGTPGMITVAASHDGQLARYSNFGRQTVDIAAPGGVGTQMILSTAPWNANNVGYVERTGTSMAAPIVTGTVALMREKHPKATAAQIREHLLSGGTQKPRLKGLIRSGAIVNAEAAVHF